MWSALCGGAAAPLPPDRLRVAALARGAACLQAAAGVPAAADACAYETTQRLLAVRGAAAAAAGPCERGAP
jgi:hypothetical protein